MLLLVSKQPESLKTPFEMGLGLTPIRPLPTPFLILLLYYYYYYYLVQWTPKFDTKVWLL